MIALIAALKPVDEWTGMEDVEAAKAAQVSFDVLTDEEKGQVSNYAVLAEQMETVTAMESMEPMSEEDTVTDNAFKLS